MCLKNQIETTTIKGTITGRERQSPVQAHQPGQVDDEQQDDAPTVDGLIGKEAAHGVHVRSRALDQFAGRCVIVIGERQPLDVIEQVIAQPPRDAFRRLSRPSPAEERERAFERRQADKAQRGERQAIKAGIVQHIVHQVAEQQERARPRDGSHSHAERGGHIESAKARHHAPQAQQAILGESALEVKRCCIWRGQVICSPS
jgi:hypothetical protein